MYYYNRYPEYVSVGEKKARAEKKFKDLLKKKSDLNPVFLESRALAKTWWGKSWNTNLEKYADYSNRIGRGRSYLRSNAVLDLQIFTEKVTSLVMGSSLQPYSITINIKKIPKKTWTNIKDLAKDKLNSLQ